MPSAVRATTPARRRLATIASAPASRHRDRAPARPAARAPADVTPGLGSGRLAGWSVTRPRGGADLVGGAVEGGVARLQARRLAIARIGRAVAEGLRALLDQGALADEGIDGAGALSTAGPVQARRPLVEGSAVPCSVTDPSATAGADGLGWTGARDSRGLAGGQRTTAPVVASPLGRGGTRLTWPAGAIAADSVGANTAAALDAQRARGAEVSAREDQGDPDAPRAGGGDQEEAEAREGGARHLPEPGDAVELHERSSGGRPLRRRHPHRHGMIDGGGEGVAARALGLARQSRATDRDARPQLGRRRVREDPGSPRGEAANGAVRRYRVRDVLRRAAEEPSGEERAVEQPGEARALATEGAGRPRRREVTGQVTVERPGVEQDVPTPQDHRVLEAVLVEDLAADGDLLHAARRGVPGLRGDRGHLVPPVSRTRPSGSSAAPWFVRLRSIVPALEKDPPAGS
jgi:hypothetical protein